MTRLQHTKRHVQLLDSLDELALDYMRHYVVVKKLKEISVTELMNWANKQTIEPTEIYDDDHRSKK